MTWADYAARLGAALALLEEAGRRPPRDPDLAEKIEDAEFAVAQAHLVARWLQEHAPAAATMPPRSDAQPH